MRDKLRLGEGYIIKAYANMFKRREGWEKQEERDIDAMGKHK